MGGKKQKLELTWIGKENRSKLEPRILVEDPNKSYHALHRVGENDLFDNKLIFGDNLLALKALEQDYAGKVKCVYIDPPYNTGSAFEYYDDGVEHSIWLSLMRDRIHILRSLLADEGSIWINLDDNEAHYLKVVCDEIFGRANFVCDVAWEKRYSPPPDTKGFGYIHDHILVYQKSSAFQRNMLPLTEDQEGRYKNPDSDARGPWKAADYTCRYSANERPNLYYPILQPNTGEEIFPKRTRVWAMSKEMHESNVEEGRIWWGAKGTNRVPAIKNFFRDINKGMMPPSLWRHTLAGHNQDGRKESLALFPGNPFNNPKPEKLIELVVKIATNPGDLVLDSFLGSGTTAAVAHKMGRRWIGVELGEHCNSHCIPRLKKVIDGEDSGGITKAIDWKGGGGFRYYKLAPSLLEKDKWDNWVISKDYNPTMLAQAICKLEGFTYEPSDTHYWMHGRSTEQDFVYVTTANLKHTQLQQLSDEVGGDRSLLVVCTSFRGNKNGYPNLTVKKIPKAVLNRCEWGKDDYSLRVENLPDAPPKPGQQGLFDGEETAQ